METASVTATATAQVCDLCGCAVYDLFRTRGRGAPLNTVICRDCGLVYSNPRPCPAQNAEYYHRAYWGEYKGLSEPDETFFQRRLPKIRSMVRELQPLLRPGVQVLEIGCGVGALLWSLRQSCNQLGTFIGIEPHDGHAKFARSQKQLDVRTGLLEELAPKLPAGAFDLVVMNHVLEHTISPTAALETVRQLLKPGGQLAIEVPNVEAPGSRLSHFFHVAHHHAFSPRTLQRLAGKTGFKLLRLETLDGDLPDTRLFALLENVETLNLDLPLKFVRDDAEERAQALEKYERWYWLTLASLRKKLTHWQRQRG